MSYCFSIIIPSYNSGAYLREAIDSALNQVDVDFELIVVNDGSTDNTDDIIDQYGSEIKYIKQDNQGLSGARNSGAKYAEGDVLAFLDADDTWHPKKLKYQNEKLTEGYPVVYTNRFNFGDVGDLPKIQSDVTPMREGDIWFDLLHGNIITASSSIINKDLFETFNGFREDLRSCEDWYLWIQVSESNLFGYCPEPLVNYRLHSGALSKNFKFMSYMRQLVIKDALSSKRSKTLNLIDKRKIISSMWATSAWESGKIDRSHAISCYLRAIYHWPFKYTLWYDIVRKLIFRV